MYTFSEVRAVTAIDLTVLLRGAFMVMILKWVSIGSYHHENILVVVRHTQQPVELVHYSVI
jgi:hypothetical protein